MILSTNQASFDSVLLQPEVSRNRISLVSHFSFENTNAARSGNRTPPLSVSKKPARTAPCPLAPPASPTRRRLAKTCSPLHTTDQAGTEHPEGDWSRGGGENSAWRTAAEVQSNPRPTPLAARKAWGPYTFRPRCRVPRGRAAPSHRAGRKQTDPEERRGKEREGKGRPGVGVRGVGSEDLARTLQAQARSRLAPRTATCVPRPTPRGRADVDTDWPSASGARGHRAVGSAPPAPQRPT